LRKNVLFLITHDVSRCRFEFEGGQGKCPNLNQLAQESTQFSMHYSNVPLCGPSRANIFTGLRPPTTGRYNNDPFFGAYRDAHPGFMTLPEAFMNGGYHSAGIGFILHDTDPGSYSEAEWFPKIENTFGGLVGKMDPSLTYYYVTDESRQVIEDRLRILISEGQIDENLCPVRDHSTPVEEGKQYSDNGTMRRVRGPMLECADVPDEAYYDGKVGAHAAEFIRSYDRKEPFFLAVGFQSTHTPYCVPKKYWDLYDREKLAMPPYRQDPADSPEWAGGDSEPGQFYHMNGYTKPWRANDEQTREMTHGHLAAISYVDAQVGKILAALKEKGLQDDTIIVFTTDHGFHDGEHSYWGKHNVWDQSMAVPLLVNVPGMARGRREIRTVTEHVDLYPTLCELCGIKTPEKLEGQSLMPLIDGETEKLHDAVYASRKHMWHDRIKAYAVARSVRTDRFRFNSYIDKAGSEIYAELFDYKNDPEERFNHFDNPAYSEMVAGMRRLMNRQDRY